MSRYLHGKGGAQYPIENWAEILTNPEQCYAVFGAKGFKKVTPIQALSWVEKRLAKKHEMEATEALHAHLREVVKSSL